MTLDVDVEALTAWNRANVRARQAYAVDQGAWIMPVSLSYRGGTLTPGRTREWLLEVLADAELVEAQAAIAEFMFEKKDAEVRALKRELALMRMEMGCAKAAV